MSKFAIIQIGKQQYSLEEGKEYAIPKLVGEKDSKIKIEHVILAGEDQELKIGKPFIDGAIVEITILDQINGEKINSRIYKAKSRYRRNRGLRKKLTKLMVNKISY